MERDVEDAFSHILQRVMGYYILIIARTCSKLNYTMAFTAGETYSPLQHSARYLLALLGIMKDSCGHLFTPVKRVGGILGRGWQTDAVKVSRLGERFGHSRDFVYRHRLGEGLKGQATELKMTERRIVGIDTVRYVV